MHHPSQFGVVELELKDGLATQHDLVSLALWMRVLWPDWWWRQTPHDVNPLLSDAALCFLFASLVDEGRLFLVWSEMFNCSTACSFFAIVLSGCICIPSTVLQGFSSVDIWSQGLIQGQQLSARLPQSFFIVVVVHNWEAKVIEAQHRNNDGASACR